MEQTARRGTTPKHPLKPMNRKPPRTQRQRWYLAMSGIILAAIVALAFLLFWLNRPVSITVGGRNTHVRIGSTIAEVYKDKHAETTPGNFLSINGRVLREGEGHPYTAQIDDRELTWEESSAYRIQGGEHLRFLDGGDVTETYQSTTEPIAPLLAFDGTGTTVEYVSQWGKAGVLEHRTGDESGEKLDVVTQEAVPCIVKRSWLFLEEDKKYVAITFDDGPAEPYTQEYLDILARYDAKATFFNLGDNVLQYPDLARRVIEEGHQLANHTMAHNQLTAVSAATVSSEINRSAQVINDTCGIATTHLRPPYGDFSSESWLASGGQVTASIRWSGDSQDWMLPGVDALVENALLNLHPGSVILMHDGGGDRSQDVEALPKILERLRDEGYTCVTMADLLRAEGSIPEEVCSGTGTMPEDATWPEQLAPEGYLQMLEGQDSQRVDAKDA